LGSNNRLGRRKYDTTREGDATDAYSRNLRTHVRDTPEHLMLITNTQGLGDFV
jgi:hypothetical protein